MFPARKENVSSKSYDLIVVGGGPAGYVGAIRAAQRGLTVALVDRDGLGGTCLHRGCIPSKGYIAAAEAVMTARHAEKIGVRFGRPEIDYAAMVGGKDQKVKKISDGIAALLKGNKVETFQGEASLQSATEVKVGGMMEAMRAELAAWLRDVHGLDLAEEALVQLATETEGWPMA